MIKRLTKTLSSLTRFFLLSVVIFLNLITHQVHAQSAYPNKPIKIVVPYPAGGAADY